MIYFSLLLDQEIYFKNYTMGPSYWIHNRASTLSYANFAYYVYIAIFILDITPAMLTQIAILGSYI
jgi:hypothetical protein